MRELHPHLRLPRPPALVLLLLLLLATGGGLAAQESDATLPMSGTEEAQRHVRAGIESALNVTPVQAARHFEMALEADPGHGPARVLHAWLAPGLSADERAAGIAAGLAMMEDATGAEVMLAAVAKNFQAGQGAIASRGMAALSETHPDVAWLAYWAALTRGARGDQTDQVAAMEAVTERFPDYGPAHNLVAYARRAQGDRAGALRAGREYLRLAGSDQPNAHDSYAELLQWEGRFDEALVHYGHAMQMDPTYGAAYTGAAEAHWLNGDPDKAVELLGMAAEHAATPAAEVTAHRSMAHVLLMQGELDEGMRHLGAAARVAEAADNDALAAFAHEEMALAEAVLGDDARVEAHLMQAGELRGEAPPPIHHTMAAMAWAAADRPDRVRTRAERTMESPAPFWQAAGHMAMGMADLEEESWESAIRHLGMADPANATTRAALAYGLGQMGREVEAESIRTELTNERQINLANPFLAYAMMRMNN